MSATKLLDFWGTIDILNYLSESDITHAHASKSPFLHAYLSVHSITKSGIGDEGVAIIADGIKKHPKCALRRFMYVIFF